jgi:sulfur carrier protein ThiS adenylyltransferase
MNLFENGLLRYLTPDQLGLIRSRRIGVGGAGGLGSNAVLLLVRTGFIHFEMLDSDVIEPSNLNRQQYFLAEIGQSKTEVLQQRLLAVNPDARIVTHQDRWTVEHAAKFFADCDLVMDALDQAGDKRAFIEYYASQGKTVVSGNGMAGLPGGAPLTVKKQGNIYFAGDGTTDVAQGHPPLAPRVAQCAAMMAETILKLTLARA